MQPTVKNAIKTFASMYFFGLLIVIQAWHAQAYQPVHPDPVLELGRWRSFPELKGLGTRCLAEDRTGRMWFGVDRGVRVYDGMRWIAYHRDNGFEDAPVHCLQATPDGRMYAGTDVGVYAFEDHAWHRIFPREADRSWVIHDLIHASDGYVWAATSQGVLRFGPDDTTLYTAETLGKTMRASLPDTRIVFVPNAVAPDDSFHVYNIYEDRNGALWFGLMNGEIVRYDVRRTQSEDASAWRRYSAQDGLEIGHRPRICQTRDGMIWTVSEDGNQGVNRFDGLTWTPMDLGDRGGSDRNFSLLETSDGTLWIGGAGALHACRNDGLTVYWASDGDIPFSSYKIAGLLEASDGALWMAEQGGDAFRLDCSASQWATYKGLNFQCETPDGAQWFTSCDSTVVRYDGKTWMQYGVDDGLMDFPFIIAAVRSGALWASGSHNGVAATARFNGHRWMLWTHPRFASCMSTGGYEAQDGTLWFGGLEARVEQDQIGGVLRFDPRADPGKAAWHHYTPPDVPRTVYGIGQTGDGHLFFGGVGGLVCFNGQAWMAVAEPEALTVQSIDQIYTTPDETLWLAHRTQGAFYYDGKSWTRYDARDALPDNRIKGFLQTGKNHMLVVTDRGASRFDGQTWISHVFPLDFRAVAWNGLRQARDGAFWINFQTWGPVSQTFRAVRYIPDVAPPETHMIAYVETVSRPGNTSLAWKGTDPWHATPEDQLQYAWRLDGGPWSAFSFKKDVAFQGLPSGDHVFEVKARDRDFNEEIAPVRVQFFVVFPVWRQPWFIGFVAVVVALVGVQTFRIMARDQKLHASNAILKKEICERQRAEKERTRIDTRLQQLQYLYRLRVALGEARSEDGMIQKAGEMLMQVLSESTSCGVLLTYANRQWQFGAFQDADQVRYERPLIWDEREHGRLVVGCGVVLSEIQERALIDETAGQIAQVLAAREMEVQLLQSARLVSLGEMAAGVVHEINQPLSVISTTAGDISLRLIEGPLLSEEKLKHMMEDILAMVDRIDKTITHMRRFSRETSLEEGVLFSINEAVEMSVKLIGAQLENHGITLHLDLADDLPPISGHAHQIEQVVLNLIANARDALDEKAEHVAEISERRITVRTRREVQGKGWVIIEVEDNGIGMDMDTMARIFEPFFTTKEADWGTGLGLSISYAIAKDHGGHIACESRREEGTVFRVRLPVAAGE